MSLGGRNHVLAVTASTVAPAMASPLRSSAVLTAAIMAGIPDMTLPVSRLVRMEVIELLFATRWNGTIVTATRVIAIVHVAVKAARAAEPRASSDEQSASEPIRTIVAVRRTVIGSIVVVTVGTVRG